MDLDGSKGPPRAFFLLFIGGIAVLVFLSLFSDVMPPYQQVYGDITLDNVLHMLAFLVLGAFAPLSFRTGSRAFAAILFLMLLGFSLEFWQLYIPNRRCQLSDAAANGLGLVVGGLLGALIRTRMKGFSKKRYFS